MSINLHIYSANEEEKTIDDIVSPPSTTPPSPVSKINHPRKITKPNSKKYENFDENTIITYKFFKNQIAPKLHQSKKREKVFIYKNQLKKTLDNLKIKYPKSLKKEELQNTLFNYFDILIKYDNNESINKINTISRAWRDFQIRKRERIYGPGYRDKSKCKNTEDCFTLETVNDIPEKYFFSIRDVLGDIFFFDVRTFYKLYKNKSDNPYTRRPFTKQTKDAFKLRHEHMKVNNIDIIYPEEQEYLNNLTPAEKIHNRLLDVFGDIDRLNVIAGGTKLEWFKYLNIIQLKKFYKVLEDVWNYRAELTESQKNEIVPGNTMFPNSVNYVFNIQSKLEIQNIVLTEMEKLVKSSQDESHQHTGAYYILISLTEISYECAQDLPWLIQY